jgi:hypothetical protein
MFSFEIYENFKYTQIMQNSSKISERIKMMDQFSQPRILGQAGLKKGRLDVGAGYGAPIAAIERNFHFLP